MRQLAVDFWAVFGYDLWKDSPFSGKYGIWWTLHMVAANLMDIKFLLTDMERKLDELSRV